MTFKLQRSPTGCSYLSRCEAGQYIICDGVVGASSEWLFSFVILSVKHHHLLPGAWKTNPLGIISSSTSGLRSFIHQTSVTTTPFVIPTSKQHHEVFHHCCCSRSFHSPFYSPWQLQSIRPKQKQDPSLRSANTRTTLSFPLKIIDGDLVHWHVADFRSFQEE